MKDIPVFATENGVASLTLKEIPYTQNAYVIVQSTESPTAFFSECADFCRAVGANRVYAKGVSCLESYHYHTTVIKMSRSHSDLPETDAALFPVLPETLEQWRGIYNEKMRNVPNAAYMTQADAQMLLTEGKGYFVHRGETLLGIGSAAGEQIEALAAVQPGAGGDVLLSLCNALSGDRVFVEVATENKRAMALYERLGFVPVSEVARWYQIF